TSIFVFSVDSIRRSNSFVVNKLFGSCSVTAIPLYDADEHGGPRALPTDLNPISLQVKGCDFEPRRSFLVDTSRVSSRSNRDISLTPAAPVVRGVSAVPVDDHAVLPMPFLSGLHDDHGGT